MGYLNKGKDEMQLSLRNKELKSQCDQKSYSFPFLFFSSCVSSVLLLPLAIMAFRAEDKNDH